MENHHPHPSERISPSSVYYCPMECEGEKVYFTPGKRCPVCNMFLVPIEERADYQNKPATFSKTNLPENFKEKIGEYFCPMFCEGDKTYNSDIGCPVCHMHLEKITPELLAGSSIQENHQHAHSKPAQNQENAGKYYCPMFCEGDKVYDSNVGCPVCGMDLVKIPEKKKSKYTCPMHPEIVKDEPGDCPICGMDLVQIPGKSDEFAEDNTVKILSRKLWIAVAFTIPVFILSMGGMWIKWPFSHQVQGILELILTLPVLF